MDRAAVMDKSVIKGLFENGVRCARGVGGLPLNSLARPFAQLMGVEIDGKYGGTGASFMSAIITSALRARGGRRACASAGRPAVAPMLPLARATSVCVLVLCPLCPRLCVRVIVPPRCR